MFKSLENQQQPVVDTFETQPESVNLSQPWTDVHGWRLQDGSRPPSDKPTTTYLTHPFMARTSSKLNEVVTIDDHR